MPKVFLCFICFCFHWVFIFVGSKLFHLRRLIEASDKTRGTQLCINIVQYWVCKELN